MLQSCCNIAMNPGPESKGQGEGQGCRWWRWWGWGRRWGAGSKKEGKSQGSGEMIRLDKWVKLVAPSRPFAFRPIGSDFHRSETWIWMMCECQDEDEEEEEEEEAPKVGRVSSACGVAVTVCSLLCDWHELKWLEMVSREGQESKDRRLWLTASHHHAVFPGLVCNRVGICMHQHAVSEYSVDSYIISTCF